MIRSPRFWKYLLLSILGIGVIFFLPHLFSKYIISILILIGIYSIAATALNLLLGNTGQISLGQAAFYGIGAYASAILTTKLSFNFWLAMPLSGVIAAVFGYIVGLTSVRLRHAYLAMATLAFNEIFIVVVEQWASVTGGVAGLTGIKRPIFLGYSLHLDISYFYLVWIILFFVYLFNRNLLCSRIGSAISAVRQDETAAAALGIKVSQYKLKIFTLSAFYTGIAGSLFAHYSRFIGPGSFHIHFSIVLLFMVELGGVRDPIGGIVGATLIVLLPEFLSVSSRVTLLPEPVRRILSEYSYHLIIYGILLFIIAAFAPEGFVKWASNLLERIINVSGRTFGVGPTTNREGTERSA
jgi:branched-chain amino acid transport system permease protein